MAAFHLVKFLPQDVPVHEVRNKPSFFSDIPHRSSRKRGEHERGKAVYAGFPDEPVGVHYLLPRLVRRTDDETSVSDDAVFFEYLYGVTVLFDAAGLFFKVFQDPLIA